MTKPDLTPEAADTAVAHAVEMAAECSECWAVVELARYGAECLAATEAWTAEDEIAQFASRGYIISFDTAKKGASTGFAVRRVLILPPEPREEGGKG